MVGIKTLLTAAKVVGQFTLAAKAIKVVKEAVPKETREKIGKGLSTAKETAENLTVKGLQTVAPGVAQKIADQNKADSVKGLEGKMDEVLKTLSTLKKEPTP